MPSNVAHFDIAICGAGPVGRTLAALLAHQGIAPERLALLDARALGQPGHSEERKDDPRSIALSYGSSQILEGIGAWPITASAITEIHVSRRGHFGRTLIDAADYDLPALGYVARYGVLVDALSAIGNAAGITTIHGAMVVGVQETADGVELSVANGKTISARIVVQAEGGLYGHQEAKSHSRDYLQTAIVAQVGVRAPLTQRAFERFTSEGPLALLPQAGDAGLVASSKPTQYALVWCMRPDTAQRMMGLSDANFLAALGSAFGTRVGQFLHTSPRSSYALGLNADPTTVTERTVAIGNAAQILHPVAGQGLNLGLRDASVLARLLSKETTPAMLRRFLTERRSDRFQAIHLTDIMARVFAMAPEGALSQALLGLSLGMVDAFGPAKRLLAEQMMFGRR